MLGVLLLHGGACDSGDAVVQRSLIYADCYEERSGLIVQGAAHGSAVKLNKGYGLLCFGHPVLHLRSPYAERECGEAMRVCRECAEEGKQTQWKEQGYAVQQHQLEILLLRIELRMRIGDGGGTHDVVVV